MTEKVAIYLRVSTEKQTEQSQLEPCKKYCEEKGWEIIGIYPDRGTSAYKNVYRPRYEEVLKLVRKRMIQHIVVWALDRWTRKGPSDIKNSVEYLSMYNVQLHSVQEQWIESINIPGIGQAFRDFFLQYSGWLAQVESQRISERIKTSERFQKAIQKGLVGRPSIYDEVEPKILELLKLGKTWREIKEQVTYTSKYGKVHHVSDPVINMVKKQNNLL